MEDYLMPAVERAMKVQAVILKAISGQLQWWQAAEILGISCRSMRRWKQRYQHGGYDGLFDRRRRRPSLRAKCHWRRSAKSWACTANSIPASTSRISATSCTSTTA